jgi:hypothetical protein
VRGLKFLLAITKNRINGGFEEVFFWNDPGNVKETFQSTWNNRRDHGKDYLIFRWILRLGNYIANAPLSDQVEPYHGI